MKLELSIVIPAYNESRRLPPFLADVRRYCDDLGIHHYEIIVVDDGSTDGMGATLEELTGQWRQLVVLRHRDNQGKGAAVRTGLRACRGELLLVADADGSTPIAEESKLRAAIGEGADVAIGSRLLQGSRSGVQRHWLRAVSGLAFAWVVRSLFGMPLRDTQCGFKMFRRDVAEHLLRHCQEAGYLIDVELLAWANRLGYQLVEAPVTWREVSGSKVRPLRDGLRMLHGLLRLRRRYLDATVPTTPGRLAANRSLVG
jgi:dolichyl-phosphate beta-glucosyltransferase